MRDVGFPCIEGGKRRSRHEARALRRSTSYFDPEGARGRRFRVLKVVNGYSRECVLQIVAFSISGQRVAHELDRLRRKLRKIIVCHNGPESISKAMFFWARRTGVKRPFIQPEKPIQNAFVESLNSQFRAYCLDLNGFGSLDDAPAAIDSWTLHYKHLRPHHPHRLLGRKPPAVFAKEAA